MIQLAMLSEQSSAILTSRNTSSSVPRSFTYRHTSSPGILSIWNSFRKSSSWFITR